MLFTGIKQVYVNVETEERKLATLYGLYDAVSIAQCVILCSTKWKVEWLAEQIRTRHDYNVLLIVSFVFCPLLFRSIRMKPGSFRT